MAIVSAGYGLVDEDRLIAPYDLTFTTMSTTAIRSRGQQLGVPAGVRARLIGHDLVFALLGSDYLTAVDPPLPAAAGQRIVYFAKPGESQIARGGGVLVPAGKVEAGRYGAGLVALKGRLLELVGAAVLRQGRALLEDIHADATPTTILAALDQQARIR